MEWEGKERKGVWIVVIGFLVPSLSTVVMVNIGKY